MYKVTYNRKIRVGRSGLKIRKSAILKTYFEFFFHCSGPDLRSKKNIDFDHSTSGNHATTYTLLIAIIFTFLDLCAGGASNNRPPTVKFTNYLG